MASAQGPSIDRKIPAGVWIAVGGIGVVAILFGEALLIHAVAAYQAPLAQYADDHHAIDEAQFHSLPPVVGPGWAQSEASLGNGILAIGLVLASVAALVRLSKVSARWLLLRSGAALIVAISSGVAALIMWRPIGLNFMYVNSGDCVGGCYFTPRPIDGWLETVTIAVILSLVLCVLPGSVAIVRSLTTRPKPA